MMIMLIFNSLESDFLTGIVLVFASVWMMQQATPKIQFSFINSTNELRLITKFSPLLMN